MRISKVVVGDTNSNHQRRIIKPRGVGGDTTPRLWHLHCDVCGVDYGAVGTAFYHRKCPACQGGAASQSFSS